MNEYVLDFLYGDLIVHGRHLSFLENPYLLTSTFSITTFCNCLCISDLDIAKVSYIVDQSFLFILHTS